MDFVKYGDYNDSYRSQIFLFEYRGKTPCIGRIQALFISRLELNQSGSSHHFHLSCRAPGITLHVHKVKIIYCSGIYNQSAGGSGRGEQEGLFYIEQFMALEMGKLRCT